MNNRIRYFLGPLIFVAFVYASSFVAYSQQQPVENSSGSISGRVSSSQKPLSGIVVQLFGPRTGQQRKVRMAEVVTDEGGNYTFKSLAPATYDVAPVTGAYVISDLTSNYGPGKSVAVGSGENVSNTNFELFLAATIKGKIKDADGHPVVSEETTLVIAEKDPAQSHFQAHGMTVSPSDSQGNYTIDNVAPGRYLLSNENPELSFSRTGANKRSVYPMRYYPGTRDPGSATVIEVTPGATLTGIDITVGSPLKTYQIAGRVIDDRTGAPIAKVGFAMTFGAPDGSGFGAGAVWKSDSNGQFRIPVVLPGHFTISPVADAAENIYGDRIEFDLTDKDVMGLEVKMHHGATVSGKVVVEGASAASDLEKLIKLKYYLLLLPFDVHSSWPTQATIDADGNFQFVGAGPGLAKLTLNSSVQGTQREFSIIKIKRDDQDLPEEIAVPSGDDVSGLQIIVKAATAAPGIIRGEVKVEGGDLDGVNLGVICRPIRAPGEAKGAMLDTHNHFVILQLQPGEYELMIGPTTSSVSNENGGKTMNRMPTVKQTVKVTAGAESEVILTVKLNPQ